MVKVNTEIKGSPEEWKQKTEELGVFGVKNSKTFVEWITSLFFEDKVKIETDTQVKIKKTDQQS